MDLLIMQKWLLCDYVKIVKYLLISNNLLPCRFCNNNVNITPQCAQQNDTVLKIGAYSDFLG